MRIPAYPSSASSATTASVPMRPSSSPTTAKMKSVCASGRAPTSVDCRRDLHPTNRRCPARRCCSAPDSRRPADPPRREKSSDAGDARFSQRDQPDHNGSGKQRETDEQPHRRTRIEEQRHEDGPRIIAVPRSCPARTSAMMRPATGTSGTSRCFHCPRTFRLRASRSAPHTTSASLANSDGCRRKPPPMEIQFLFPLKSRPITGTSASSTTMTSSEG